MMAEAVPQARLLPYAHLSGQVPLEVRAAFADAGPPDAVPERADGRSNSVVFAADRYINPDEGGISIKSVIRESAAQPGVIQLPPARCSSETTARLLAEIADHASQLYRDGYVLSVVGEAPGLAAALETAGVPFPAQIISEDADTLLQFLDQTLPAAPGTPDGTVTHVSTTGPMDSPDFPNVPKLRALMGDRKGIALVASCIMATQVKVGDSSHCRGIDHHVMDIIDEAGWRVLQMPCPELGYFSAKRLWTTREQMGTEAYREHCRRLATLVVKETAELAEQDADLLVIGVSGSPSMGVYVTFSAPDANGEPGKRLPPLEDTLKPGMGVFIRELEAAFVAIGRALPRAVECTVDLPGHDETRMREWIAGVMKAQSV